MVTRLSLGGCRWVETCQQDQDHHQCWCIWRLRYSWWIWWETIRNNECLFSAPCLLIINPCTKTDGKCSRENKTQMNLTPTEQTSSFSPLMISRANIARIDSIAHSIFTGILIAWAIEHFFQFDWDGCYFFGAYIDGISRITVVFNVLFDGLLFDHDDIGHDYRFRGTAMVGWWWAAGNVGPLIF